MKRALVSERWLHIIREIETDRIKHDILLKAVEMFLCLSGTSVPMEHVFCVMNNMWTDQKSHLCQDHGANEFLL
jgi:hypothetical protein